ncbi:hypothetical protein BHM03_00054110 [Ensete ventricosum]|nr:hypothetical protein BHM03_00054110 [Ensete ventricosum]
MKTVATDEGEEIEVRAAGGGGDGKLDHHIIGAVAEGTGEDEVDGDRTKVPRRRKRAQEIIVGLLGWHKGDRQKKIETRRKIVGGSRKACQELGRFTEEIGKLARNMLGDRWRKTVRLTAGDFEGCRNMGVRH